MTSKFVAGMDETKRAEKAAAKDKTLGENGAPEHTAAGVGDPRVALFFKLVRGLDAKPLAELVDGVLHSHAETGDVQLLVDLIVMAFQTRGVRGQGKGEKRLFVDLFLAVHERFPETAVRLVELVPHYGYFKDWLLLAEAVEALDDSERKARAQPLVREVLRLFAARLAEDGAKAETAEKEGNTPQLSLAAKWAPREGRHYSHMARALAKLMFPEASDDAARRLYRLRVASLNRALETPEVLMSAQRYAEIDFARVASLCLNRYRKAFLNERVKGRVDRAHEETGNRHPEDEDRVSARKRLREMAAEGKASKLKGAALQPHEVVAKVSGHSGGQVSTLEADVLDAQWRSLRESVRSQLAEAAKRRAEDAAEDAGPEAAAAAGKAAAKGVDMGKVVALVDVSGSMAGLPMEVAVALGILVSELTHPAFRDRFLTFESNPTWVDLSACASIREKAVAAKQAPWGGSTNFAKALERILEVVVRDKLKPDEVPDLIVFSDMQFDAAGGKKWETHFERVQRKFAEAGRTVCGEPYPAPRVIFWNLRGNTVGFPAQANTPNVQMLSGFSPSLFKLVVSGEDLVGDEEEVTMPDGTVRTVKSGPTPYETLRKALDDPCFDAVRRVVADVGEGDLGKYVFEREEAGFAVL